MLFLYSVYACAANLMFQPGCTNFKSNPLMCNTSQIMPVLAQSVEKVESAQLYREEL